MNIYKDIYFQTVLFKLSLVQDIFIPVDFNQEPGW